MISLDIISKSIVFKIQQYFDLKGEKYSAVKRASVARKQDDGQAKIHKTAIALSLELRKPTKLFGTKIRFLIAPMTDENIEIYIKRRMYEWKLLYLMTNN